MFDYPASLVFGGKHSNSGSCFGDLMLLDAPLGVLYHETRPRRCRQDHLLTHHTMTLQAMTVDDSLGPLYNT